MSDAARKVRISGTGVFTPPERISNEELVEAYNAFADNQNALNSDAISAGELAPLPHSSVEFIEKASGIESRYVMNKSGILDPDIMHPVLPERTNDEPGVLAEMSLKAAEQAFEQSGRKPDDIDAVIVACSNSERAYPAVAIEVQELLGIEGFGFDMNVACSSATFGIQVAHDMIANGSSRAILLVNPEICSGHLEFRDRDCHFIFGDVATAVILEAENLDRPEQPNAFAIRSTRCLTQFSNNIRNNFGFLNRTRQNGWENRDKLFVQEGRKVFKQVVPIVSDMLLDHVAAEGLKPQDIMRLWLHQANKGMNDMIGRKVMGREPTPEEQPNILQEYANTSSAGSIIAFSKFSEDLETSDVGIICSFGAGYSVGSVVLEKL